MQQAWTANDFQGLTPGIDARRSDKLFVLNGRNYVFDSIGPRSDFGDRFLTPFPVGRFEHCQGVRLRLRDQDRVFTMVGDSVLEWDEQAGNWRTIYETGITNLQPFRWTVAYLDGRQYMCHPAVGILVYDVDSRLCLPLDTPGCPSQPIAITENNGRLCAIDMIEEGGFFSWSATGNGLDWVPRLGGPGFQKINERVSGAPLMLTAFEGGCLTWTTGGLMRSEFTGDQSVFRHRAVNTKLRPINSFCTVQMEDNTTVILDERGLFKTQGGPPVPFNALFNEFLLPYIQKHNLRVGQNLRLEWDELQRRLYLSVSLSRLSPIYESCFVLYPSVEKWGQFNESHHGILPLRIGTGDRADDYYGYVDSTGRVRYWNQLGSRETLPSSKFLNGLRSVVQRQSQPLRDEAGYVGSSSARVGTTPASERGGPAGYFNIGGGVPAPAQLAGLSASIQLGLIKFDLAETDDQLTEVVSISVGNMIEGDADVLSQGFSIDPILEAETLGLEPPNFLNCKFRIVSTIDGRSAWDQSEPIITRVDAGLRHYACSTTGMWHIIEFKAEDVGEAFQLHSLALTATYAGKLA